MSTFGERLKELRLEKDLTQKDLGRVLQLTKNAITMYEKGERTPKYEKLEEIADFFNVDMDYLMGKVEFKTKYEWNLTYKSVTEPRSDTPDFDIFSIQNISPIETQRFPMLGEIACGEPTFASEEFGVYVSTGKPINADFCLRAKGDSMIGARIFEGDIVFVRKQEMVENGEIAVVLVDDEATLKRVRYDKVSSELLLIPENPAHQTMRFFGEELNRIRIIGKAVAFLSDVR